MKLNVGFVGFDGTESKRAIPAIHQVKEAEGIEGDMNVLLRSPHGRAKSMLSKFTRMCNVRAFLTDEKDRAAWEKVGARIEGGYDDFFEESGVIVIGTPEGQELPNVEASIAHDCNMVLMGGAHRGDILNGLAEKKIGITEKIREDLGREFFFGLEKSIVVLQSKEELSSQIFLDLLRYPDVLLSQTIKYIASLGTSHQHHAAIVGYARLNVR